MKRTALISIICLVACFQIPATTSAQDAMSQINPAMQPAMKIDVRKVRENGLRQITGQHVTIYTDVPASDAIEELAKVFDLAVPQWCRYFGVDGQRTQHWKMKAFLIRDKSRFEKSGLIPADLPQFPAGLNRGHEIWLFVQPDEYYTRHLLLHEGTHAFMQWFGNGLGAPWYAEGMAELLALHEWNDGKLSIHHLIANSTQSEGWGRPKLIKRWVMGNEKLEDVRSLQNVFLTPNRAFAEVENYAWCWAACEFLEKHPLSSERFAQLQKEVAQLPEAFNASLMRRLAGDLEVLERDWALFIRDLDYGYSPVRSAVTELEPQAESDHFVLKTNVSWQFWRIPVTQGQSFNISAEGRFQVGNSMVNGKEKPWDSEPDGITIDYYRGRPLGELQALVVPRSMNASSMLSLCRQTPISVGAKGEIQVRQDGLLCFRINESPSKMEDNRGTLKIAIEKVD